MTDAIIPTKIMPPPVSASHLPRERLFSALQRSLVPECRLVLVCAPAGYGKSSLVSAWVRETSLTLTSWLSLDAADNDPLTFFSDLAAALARALPALPQTLNAMLGSPQGISPQAFAALVINELARLEQPLNLVLDDYHLIQNQSIHEGVTFLIDFLPANMRVLIATRSDPPLPLHRYRARGQMVELRAADLRFGPDEVPPLMQRLAGVSLNPNESALLESRTEGWAAGLQMAALALRGKARPGALLTSLVGSQRYILDYFAEEIYNAQPPEVQRFLLASSLLERFNAGLLDALLDTRDAAEIIGRLERANLFIIALDDAAGDSCMCWYRYHHLFADLLKARATETSAHDTRLLHRRAADWLGRNGCAAEAVQHALLAGDYDRAAGLVERHTLALFSQGELNRLLGWVRLLPAEVAARRPRLLLYQAWATAFAGQIDETGRLINQAEALAQPGGTDADALLLAEVACIRGVSAVMIGRFDQALALEALPAERLDALTPFVRCGVDWALGYAYRTCGDLARATQCFEHMLATARQNGLLWSLVTAAVDCGAVLRLGGKLRQAEGAYREALAAAAQSGADQLGYVGRLESFLATVLYEQNRLEEAQAAAQASIAHNRLWRNANHDVHAYLIAHRIDRALDNASAADNALAQADTAAQTVPLVTTLRAALETAHLRAWLDAGDLAQAMRWVRDQRIDADTRPAFDEAQVQRIVAKARVLLAAGERDKARDLLADLRSALERRGLVNALIEAQVLAALCAPTREDALTSLSQALALGLPQGYARVYLDEGAVLVDLLRACRALDEMSAELRLYLDELLQQAGVKSSVQSSNRFGLTERELEILKAMARGLNNQQIGAELYISAGTVKAHSASIYRKLDVANRTEAIARAKDAGLC